MASLMVQDAIIQVDGGTYTVRVQLFDAAGVLVSEATSQPVIVADPGPLEPQVQMPVVTIREAGPGRGPKARPNV
jgi:hypothetical protein